MIAITIYSRPGCHLCDEMKAAVQGAVQASGVAARIDEIDISTDPALEARYGIDIPVLLVDGTKTAKHRVTEGEVTRMLHARGATSR